MQKQYFRETKNPLHLQMNGHRSDYYAKLPDKPVADHFIIVGHTFEDLTLMVIEQIVMIPLDENNRRVFGYMYFRPWHQTASI